MSKKEIPKVPLPSKKSDEEEKEVQQPLQEKPKDPLDEILEDDDKARASAEGHGGHGETPQIDENSDTMLKNLSPPYSNQNQNVGDSKMAKVEEAKGIEIQPVKDVKVDANQTTGVIKGKRNPSVVLIGCGGSGAKIITNQVIGGGFTGDLVTRTIDLNNKNKEALTRDLKIYEAISGTSVANLRGATSGGVINILEYLDWTPNFQGIDVKAYTADWTGDLLPKIRGPNVPAKLSATNVPLKSFKDTLDNKLPTPCIITYSEIAERCTGIEQVLQTGGNLAVGHAFMRGITLPKADIQTIVYALPEFIKEALLYNKETKQIDIVEAIRQRKIDDNGDGTIFIKGQMDVSKANDVLKVPITYKLEQTGTDAKGKPVYEVADADIQLVALFSSMNGGTGGAILEGLADLLYDMKKNGWDNAPVGGGAPYFATLGCRTYARSAEESASKNAVVNIISVLRKSRRVGKGEVKQSFIPAVNTDIIVSADAVFAANDNANGKALEDGLDLSLETDRMLVNTTMAVASALDSQLQGACGSKDLEIKELANYMSGRAIAGCFAHKDHKSRPQSKEGVYDELKVLAKPASYNQALKTFDGLLFKEFDKKDFFDKRMKPGEYVDAVIKLLREKKNRDEILQAIPDSEVPIEYLTPEKVFFILTAKKEDADKQDEDVAKSQQVEAKYLIDNASIIWRNAKAMAYNAVGKKEATEILIGGPATITTEDLVYLYNNADMVYSSFDKKKFRDVFSNDGEHKKDLWGILKEDEIPYVAKSKQQLEVLAATSNAASETGMYVGDAALRTLAYVWNAIYDRNALAAKETDQYLNSFGKPLPPVPVYVAPVAPVTPEVRKQIAEVKKQEAKSKIFANGFAKLKSFFSRKK
jgi:hypothetical protein